MLFGRLRAGVALPVLVGLITFATPLTVDAQGYRRGGTRVRLGDGLPDRPGGFTFCRLAFLEVRREPGGSSWDTTSLRPTGTSLRGFPNLLLHRSLDGNTVSPGSRSCVPPTPICSSVPFLFASHVGVAGFEEDEAAALGEYLEKGGFLWVDDFWGNAAWNQWVRQMELVLPGRTIVDLPMEHPLFEIVYDVPRLPQIPSIQHWRRSGGGTSERGFESRQPHIRAVLDDDGRIMVLITHNTDIADGWEREAEDPQFFYSFSPDAYAVGVNVVVWMMTH